MFPIYFKHQLPHIKCSVKTLIFDSVLKLFGLQGSENLGIHLLFNKYYSYEIINRPYSFTT